MSNPTEYGYSAKVVLTLAIGGTRLVLSHVAPNYFIVRELDEVIPATLAKMFIEVDGRVKSQTVFLPHGISAANQRVTFY